MSFVTPVSVFVRASSPNGAALPTLPFIAITSEIAEAIKAGAWIATLNAGLTEAG